MADDGWETINDPLSLHTSDGDGKDAVIVSNLLSLQSQLTSKLKLLDDELNKLSDERRAINELKNDLTHKIDECTQLSQQQNARVKEANLLTERLGEIRDEMVKELESSRQTRMGLEDDRTKLNADSKKLERQVDEVKKTRSQLEDNLAELSGLRETGNKNRSLLEKLSILDRQTSDTQRELEKLQSIRQQHEEQLKQAKIESETIRTLQVNTLKQLNDGTAFGCKECGTHIGDESDVESKCYQVGQGHFTEKKRGFLFANAYNLTLGKPKTETFTTGSYQISWVSCMKCNNQLGWKYLSSDNTANNSKVGKFCLARYSLTSPDERH